MVAQSREAEAEQLANRVSGMISPSSTNHNIQVVAIHSPFLNMEMSPVIMGYGIQETGPLIDSTHRDLFDPYEIIRGQTRKTKQLAMVYLDPEDQKIRVWAYTEDNNLTDRIESLSEVSEDEDLAYEMARRKAIKKTPRRSCSSGLGLFQEF